MKSRVYRTLQRERAADLTRSVRLREEERRKFGNGSVSYDVAVPFCVRPQPAAVAFGRLARNLKELKRLKSVWGMEYPPRVRAKWPLSRRWAADRPHSSYPRIAVRHTLGCVGSFDCICSVCEFARSGVCNIGRNAHCKRRLVEYRIARSARQIPGLARQETTSN